mmetsp:Transcript_21139/g.42660  ORF Transcript_21139/g.42660 Transcript_21139/m.42660 type:complete len:86 (+) Transcript_21139:472-729(+)
MVAVNGGLPPSLQEALLLRGGDANLDRFVDDLQAATGNTIIHAIEKIAVDKERTFKVAPDSEFERMVLKAASRFRDDGDEENHED